MNILIIYESLGGNTKTFVDWFLNVYGWNTDYNITVKTVREMKENLTFFEEYDIIILGTYTWANGKIPVETKKFVIQEREKLRKSNLFLFGSGITIYANFCGALDNIEIILSQSVPKIKFELTFLPEEHQKDIEFLKTHIEKVKRS